MTAKQKGYDAALPLRLPPELKDQCSSLARKNGLATNEWINQPLEKALTPGFTDELITDEQLNTRTPEHLDTWYEQEFLIPGKTDEPEKPAREENNPDRGRSTAGVQRKYTESTKRTQTS